MYQDVVMTPNTRMHSYHALSEAEAPFSKQVSGV